MNIKNLSELIYLSNAGNESSVLQIGLLGSDTLVEIFYRVVPKFLVFVRGKPSCTYWISYPALLKFKSFSILIIIPENSC